MDKRKYIKPKEYAEIAGLHYRTIVRKYKEGKIEGINDGVRIYLKNPNYQEPQEQTQGSRVILYARVSSSTNKASLDGQIERMRDYSAAKGYTIVREVKEVASGLNDKRKKLNSILESKDWDILLVEHKDRLTRFGFNYFNTILNKNEQRVEAINSSIKKDKDEEIIEDLIAIITSFYGRNRKNKTKQIIEDLKNEQEEG